MAEDKSSTEHTFVNSSKTDTYNDLHIKYNWPIDGSDPTFATAGGASETGWSKGTGGDNLDITGSFPPGSSITVTAYSAAKAGLKVEKYWWTFDGEKVGSDIPVLSRSANIRDKDGDFEYSTIVDKHPVISVTITGTINIKGGPAGVKVTTSDAGGGNTTVSITGTLNDPKVPGKVSMIIDPPGELYDYIVNITVGAFGSVSFPIDRFGLVAYHIGSYFRRK